jgi:predicted ATPase
MLDDKLRLKNISLKGYKSFSSNGQNIPFGEITVLIGANGAGKSNLISFFQMLNFMTSGTLQTHIGKSGYADSILYYGSKRTSRLEAEITFSDINSVDKYTFTLSHAAGDTLIFTDEAIYLRRKKNPAPLKISLAPGLKESGLYEYAKNPESRAARIILDFLTSCQVFQFHDTSKEAKIRNSSYINDCEYLRSDAGNLAAFLYAVKNKKDGEKYFNRIVRYIKLAMPQFNDFVLTPSARNENYIMLNWLENDSDYLFGPHQISDGSLRFISLATLLLQPPDSLPSVVVLDEPELGLHPFAISLLAGMVKTASQSSQIILATQSTRLIDEFDADSIVIVERDKDDKCSIFKRLDLEVLQDWLEKYSMSELWEKNIFGGRP